MMESYRPEYNVFAIDRQRREDAANHLAQAAIATGEQEQEGTADPIGSSGPPGRGAPSPDSMQAINQELDVRSPIDSL
jgi:hypothetical protein